MNQNEIQLTVKQALFEDLGGLSPQEGDITANLIPVEQQANAKVISRENAILCGSAWATEAFLQVDSTLQIKWLAADGDKIEPNECFLEISGNARSILTAERTALNFLQTLSATATVTAECVALLAGGKAKLLDTRKTIPGLRNAQKYAVSCGGGVNHRIGLYDAFLIKENHILACGSINAAVTQARQSHPDKKVEVEVENLEELRQAIDSKADIVMLDNFSKKDLLDAVAINQGITRLEVSGNITKTRLLELRDVGVDYISSGALTKHIDAIDLSLRLSIV